MQGNAKSTGELEFGRNCWGFTLLLLLLSFPLRGNKHSAHFGQGSLIQKSL
jgi:hypothetical protein